ncbi:MAG: recombination-associated protein RdgC [Chromatiales bacterium]|nr:recombination-associated protein RdgC [Chromatiales bacterium]
MWFRNLQIYLLTKPFELTPEALHEQLQEKAARACGSLEMATIGWQSPLGRAGSQLTHAVGKCTMVCVRKDEKVLPAAVVREVLAERIAEIEEAEARKVRRREQTELRDEIMQDLLPKAFSKSSQTYAYIDAKNGWLVVDASSPKRAEELITLMRETLGTFQVRPVAVEQSPAAVMTAWLNGHPSGEFIVQDECELRDPVEEGAIVRCRRQDLESEEIATHINAGKQVVRLALDWGERLSFLLADDMTVRRLRFLDVIQEEAAEAEGGDEATRFDVDFSLMSLELERFLPRLFDALGGIAKGE